MNYRSVADLNDAICTNMRELPPSVDLVVGIPRSGILPAALVSLMANVPLADVEGLLSGRVMAVGRTGRLPAARGGGRYRHALVVDDSVDSGRTFRETRDRIRRANLPLDVTYCAVYGRKRSHPLVDVILEKVPYPRVFQWNLFHHPILREACVDIDGVLCCDPTEAENDDGPTYRAFLDHARPLCVPTKRIGCLVTSRLEKYRPETERWLRRNNIAYDRLVMLDRGSKEERLREGIHGRFKAEVYRSTGALLFIESEHRQACEIAKLSGKPVLSIGAQQVITPDWHSRPALLQSARTLPRRLKRSVRDSSRLATLRSIVRRAVGPRTYGWLRSVRRSANVVHIATLLQFHV